MRPTSLSLSKQLCPVSLLRELPIAIVIAQWKRNGNRSIGFARAPFATVSGPTCAALGVAVLGVVAYCVIWCSLATRFSSVQCSRWWAQQFRKVLAPLPELGH